MTVVQRAPRTLECSPLHTYTLAALTKPDGAKALVRAGAGGGALAWHVHVGILDEGHSGARAEQGCAFVLHAVNLWTGRIGRGEFTRRKGRWKAGVLPGNYSGEKEYERHCLPAPKSSLVP